MYRKDGLYVSEGRVVCTGWPSGVKLCDYFVDIVPERVIGSCGLMSLHRQGVGAEKVCDGPIDILLHEVGAYGDRCRGPGRRPR